MRISSLTTAAALAALAIPAGATASVGTGVGATPLALTAAVKAGGSYRFPPLYVKNTGTVRSTYAVRVQRIAPVEGQRVVPAWIHLRPARLTLAPGRIGSVAVTISLPAAAASGRYMTDLVATTYAPHRPGAPALGAAAADRLSFSVPSTPGPPLLALAAIGLAALLASLALAPRLASRRRPTAGSA